MTDELKPCKCGAEPAEALQDYTYKVSIYCPECGEGTRWCDTPYEAWREWRKMRENDGVQAPLASAEARIAALEAQLADARDCIGLFNRMIVSAECAWKEQHPDSECYPDVPDLIVWLKEQVDKLAERRCETCKQYLSGYWCMTHRYSPNVNASCSDWQGDMSDDFSPYGLNHVAQARRQDARPQRPTHPRRQARATDDGGGAMADDVTLKPCPFCGSDDVRAKREAVKGTDDLVLSVSCRKCHALVQEWGDKAIALWNTRVSDPRIAALEAGWGHCGTCKHQKHIEYPQHIEIQCDKRGQPCLWSGPSCANYQRKEAT